MFCYSLEKFCFRSWRSPQADAATLQEVNKESRTDTKAPKCGRIALRSIALTVASCKYALSTAQPGRHWRSALPTRHIVRVIGLFTLGPVLCEQCGLICQELWHRLIQALRQDPRCQDCRPSLQHLTWLPLKHAMLSLCTQTCEGSND